MITNVPESMAAKLRARAERNDRSLQGELMAILENAATEPNVSRAGASGVRHKTEVTTARADGLLDRLLAIAGERGIDTTTRLTREQAHDRKVLRKSSV
ncbi:MAG: Arc family DNA-binding protein [Burkholderiales bacterium]|nr:Arc family DNA-binding protein [Betaproteobacteria bacterium]MBP8296005.1 Arc family DNA-binding protein [Burkholderiales bacterium]